LRTSAEIAFFGSPGTSVCVEVDEGLTVAA
jgi:hypothetical protein